MHLNDLFIEPEGAIDKKEFQPASYVRREFVVQQAITSATLTMTACGMYKGFINGRPVSDQQFMPGCTYYKKRLQYQTYDVAHLLKPETNVIGAVVADGWYRGKIGVQSNRYFYGDKLMLLAVLRIQCADGSEILVTTDDQWQASQAGPIRKSDWKDGEVYDATREMPGWSEPGFTGQGWHQVYPAACDVSLVPSAGAQILEKERFTPTVLTTPDESTVLDFAQNLFGYVTFSVTGEKGQTVKLTHGETLDENGNFTQKNLIPEGILNKVMGMGEAEFQVIEYTLKDGRQTYQPSFTAQGFQYVKVENWPEAVRPENFTAVAVYSDMAETGSFHCSHKLINQLYHNSVWSQKGNFLDIPTDCPTRERAGWTGDIAAFCEAGSYQMDTYPFLAKWLKDVALQQYEDGKVPSIVPDVGLFRRFDGSAGWADAAVIVPYTLYKMYGRRQVLEDQYVSMKKWVDFVQRRARQTGLRGRFKANPYNDYLVDTGYHWGEWLEPGHVMAQDALKNILVPDTEVATAYYAYSAGLLAEIAAVLGQTQDAARYSALAEQARAAYRHAFTQDGIVHSDRQARYVRPIALDLLSAAEKEKNAALLNDRVIKNEYRIGTGFLTTPFILPVLTDYGYADTAYRMIENRKRPGWLYNVEKGATTIWENWNGKDEQGVPKDSFNHYAFGAVTRWFFSHIAGITPLQPGFQEVQIKPVPGGSLTFVECTYQSAAGPIKSVWQKARSSFRLNIQVPVQTTVHLPDGAVHRVLAGDHAFSCALVA